MSYMVKELFNTIQGEGGRMGRRSVFLRFAGCNYWNGKPEGRTSGAGPCSTWCDTDFVGGTKMAAAEIVRACNAEWPDTAHDRWVVCTGGEPMLQLDAPLISAFHAAGWSVAVETNGSKPVPDTVDWVCVSPKGPSMPLIQTEGNEVKVILPSEENGPSDWTPAQIELLRMNTRFKHYLVQPQDGIPGDVVGHSHLQGYAAGADVYQRSLARCLRFVNAHPQWALTLQTHKMVGVR